MKLMLASFEIWREKKAEVQKEKKNELDRRTVYAVQGSHARL